MSLHVALPPKLDSNWTIFGLCYGTHGTHPCLCGRIKMLSHPITNQHNLASTWRGNYIRTLLLVTRLRHHWWKVQVHFWRISILSKVQAPMMTQHMIDAISNWNIGYSSHFWAASNVIASDATGHGFHSWSYHRFFWMN